MSVELVKHGPSDTHDSYEFVLKDGDTYAVFSFSSGLHIPPRSLDAIGHELRRALRRLSDRKGNVPNIGDRVRLKGDPDERTVIALNRTEGKVTLSYSDGRQGVGLEGDTVPWASCEYAS